MSMFFLSTKKRKFKLKWLIWLSGGALISSAIITPVIVINAQEQNNQKLNDANSSLPTEGSVAQLLNDALTKISKKIYWMDHKDGYDNSAHDDVIKQTGAFLFNVNKAVSDFQSIGNNKNKQDNEQDLLNVKYNAILREAAKIGADLNDYSLAIKNKEATMGSYMNMLISAGVDPTQAKQKTDQFSNVFDVTTTQGENQLWDPFEFTYHLATGMFENGLSAKQIKSKNLTDTPTSTDIQKQAALNFAQRHLNQLLTVIPDTDFTKKIIDYSANGQYDVNDEIGANDLSQLFNFAYDRTEGAILSKVDLSNIDINVNDLKPSESGDYDNALNQYEIKPLSTYSGYGATYGLAEIIPGYKLHLRITGKDVWADSHKCHLDLQFGISATASDQDQSNVLWAPINDDAHPLSIEINVKKDEVKYISQHEYYPNKSVNITSGSYDSNQDRYYDVSSPDIRIPLYYLMSTYGKEDANQDYIVSKDDPMYVDPSVCKGIDIPQINPAIPIKDGCFHANQKLKLVVTDVNTNSEGAGQHAFSVLAHWAIIDSDKNNGNYEAQTFNWNDNGTIKNDIWINFYVDPQWAKVIDFATHVTEDMNKLNFFDCLNTVIHQNQDNVDKILTQKISFLASMNVAQAGLIALTSTDTAILIASGGFAAYLSFSIVLNTAAVGLLVTADVVEGKEIDSIRKFKKVWKKFSNYYDINIKDTFAKIGSSILARYQTIWDPHKDLLIKQQAANDISSTIATMTTDYRTFLTNIMNVITAENDNAEEQNLAKWRAIMDSLTDSEMYSNYFMIGSAALPGLMLGVKLFGTVWMRWGGRISQYSSGSYSVNGVDPPADLDGACAFVEQHAPELTRDSPLTYIAAEEEEENGSLPNSDDVSDSEASSSSSSSNPAPEPAPAPDAPAALPPEPMAAVDAAGVAGGSSPELPKGFKGGPIGMAIATALLVALTTVLGIIQIYIDDLANFNFSDGTVSYGIISDKPNFAIDSSGNTVIGDEIIFKVIKMSDGSSIDNSKIVWNILSTEDKPENYVTLIGNKLRIDHLPTQTFNITIQAIIQVDNKKLLVEWIIPLPIK